MSKRIGLTGGMGSGKTTVGLMFADYGVPVYNSDTEAKKLMETSVDVRKELKNLLGDEAYTDKRLNKTYISERIFSDTSLLQKMNSIVHPAVRKHFLVWAASQKAVYVIQEAAIIFEIGSQDFYDSIVLVTAPENTRIKRIKSRSAKNTTRDIKARMRHQWQDDEKIKGSDYVIENVILQNTRAAVLEVHRKLLKRYRAYRF